MTTIAVDIRKKILYVDSMITISRTGTFSFFRSNKEKTKSSYTGFNKIFHDDGKTIITGAGNVFCLLRFIKTWNPKDLNDNTECLKITKSPFKLEIFRKDHYEAITEFNDTDLYLVGSGHQQVGSVINYLRNVNDYKLSDIDMFDVISNINDPYTGGEIRKIDISDKYQFEDMYE